MTGHPAGSSTDREYPKAEPHPKRNRVEPEQPKANLKRDRPEDGEKLETQAARPPPGLSLPETVDTAMENTVLDDNVQPEQSGGEVEMPDPRW